MKQLIENGYTHSDVDEWESYNDIVQLKSQYWKVEVKNFGWRKTSGVAYFKVNDFSQLIYSILPNTECTFNVFRDGGNIKVQNFHHDSNTGKEWYTCRPCAESTYLKHKR